MSKNHLKDSSVGVVKNLANTRTTNYSDPKIVIQVIDEYIIKFEDSDLLNFKIMNTKIIYKW